MYRSLAGPKEREAALATARTFDPTMLDDGDSLTYLLAFIMSRH